MPTFLSLLSSSFHTRNYFPTFLFFTSLAFESTKKRRLTTPYGDSLPSLSQLVCRGRGRSCFGQDERIVMKPSIKEVPVVQLKVIRQIAPPLSCKQPYLNWKPITGAGLVIASKPFVTVGMGRSTRLYLSEPLRYLACGRRNQTAP